jgi:hypothetical protein
LRRARSRLSQYTPHYFEEQNARSLDSARLVVPVVMSVVAPRSVVDVGCGNGAWLCAFRENGVREVHGYDGASIEPTELLIPAASFTRVDLEDPAAPVEGRFDLAVSLEVAEHLSPQAGDRLVERLTQLAPVVLFSAALPRQGGTGHRNEQWPAYWIERFRDRGFLAFDSIRRSVFFDSRVEWFYRQNLLLFASADWPRRETLKPLDASDSDDRMVDWVNHRLALRTPTLRESLLNILPAAWRAVAYRGRRLL